VIEIKKTNFNGWSNCCKISNGEIELIVTTDVGPRIIRLAFIGDKNFFAEFDDQAGTCGGEEWKIYGGHRVWTSPESKALCYYPDNFPVDFEILPDGIKLKQKVDPDSLIEKEIIITFGDKPNQIFVNHKLTNCGNWPVTFAVWALSVMNIAGTAILPQYRVADEEGLLSNRSMALWPYTDMNDTRVFWGKRYTLISQDVKKENPFKIGLTVPEKWACYNVNNNLFVKKFSYDKNMTYPDGGMNVETYTNHKFLELESLGHLQNVAPGQSIEHLEEWQIFKNIGTVKTEDDVEKKVIPLIE
jgi:hypothetical protein